MTVAESGQLVKCTPRGGGAPVIGELRIRRMGDRTVQEILVLADRVLQPRTAYRDVIPITSSP